MRPRRHPVRTAALAGVVVIILIPLLGDRGRHILFRRLNFTDADLSGSRGDSMVEPGR